MNDESDFSELNDMKEDKIINNSYNTGEIEYEDFSFPMKVHDKVAGQYKENLSENIMEERTIKMLETDLYEIFTDSPFFNKYKKIKRVDKSDMIKMYYYFKERVEHSNYSATQFFMGFAEFFQINYDQLYGEVTVKEKELILRELNDKNGLKRKIQMKRLF